MSFNIFDTYFPAATTISAERIASMRTRLAAWLKLARADLDTRPGSVFDVGALSPYASLLAGLETALERIRTDMSPADVARGLAFDCPWIESYLTALGGLRQESLVTAGIIELQFSADSEVNIPAGWQVSFNDVAFDLVDTDGIRVIRQGQSISTARDRRLRRVSSGVYAVRIPVQSQTSVEVTAGSSGSGAAPLPSENLTGILAVTNFRPGRANNTVAAMAARALQGFQFRGFSTPASIREQLLQTWPDLHGVEVVAPGDEELLRPGRNAFGLQEGMADAWICSYSSGQECVEIKRAKWIPALNSFYLLWRPQQHMTELVGVTWAEDVDVVFTDPVSGVTQVSTDTVISKLDAARTSLAEFHVLLPMPLDNNDAAAITPLTDDDGDYALLQFRYRTEPALPVLEKYVMDQGVIGLDLRVRAANEARVTSLVCEFVRSPGVVFNDVQARLEIASYINSTTPGDGFDRAAVFNSLLVAGAWKVKSVTSSVVVRPSPAGWWVPPGTSSPEVDNAAFEAAQVEVPSLSGTFDASDFDLVDPVTRAAVNYRTCVYRIDPAAITFVPHLA